MVTPTFFFNNVVTRSLVKMAEEEEDMTKLKTYVAYDGQLCLANVWSSDVVPPRSPSPLFEGKTWLTQDHDPATGMYRRIKSTVRDGVIHTTYTPWRTLEQDVQDTIDATVRRILAPLVNNE